MSAFSIVPAPEDGEAIRSYSDRVRLLSRMTKDGFSVAALRRRNVELSWTVPCAVSDFSAHVGRLLDLHEAKYWLRQHTLAPFWWSTLSAAAKARYEGRLLASTPGPRKPVLPLDRTEWLEAAAVLCPACDEVNVARLGFSYVDRRWLLPFLTRCHLHGDRLATFSNWRPSGRGRPQSVLALPGRAANGKLLSQRGQELLRSEDGELLANIERLLDSRGFVTTAGRLRRKALIEMMVRYADRRFEHPGLDRMFSTAETVAKLLAPLWSARSFLHPFVADQLMAALELETPVQAQHARQVSARSQRREALERALSQRSNATQAAREASVSVTTATVAALAAGKDVKLRPKLLKANLRAKVERLLATGTPMPKVATKAGISLVTAYRVLKANPAVQEVRAKRLATGRLEDARAAWLDARRTWPEYSATELRRVRAAAYAYLYRHDKAWLAENLPQLRPHDGASVRTRRSPPGADQALAKRVAEKASERNNQLRAPQATRTRLAAEAGRPRLQVRCAPLATAALAQQSESTEDFVLRRLGQAVCDLRNRGMPVLVWRVVRESGLRASTIERSGVNVQQVIFAVRADAINGGRRVKT